MIIFDTDNIVNILQNINFNVISFNSQYITLEDPFCITRAFESTFNLLFNAINLLTGVLLIGYAITLVRSVNIKIKENLITLFIIFSFISSIKPLLNIIYGQNVFGISCSHIDVSVDEIQNVLNNQQSTILDHKTNIANNKESNTTSNKFIEQNNKSNKSIEMSSNKVIYINNDGTKTARINGSRSWRNKNPGNIRFSKLMVQAGAIGEAGGFAVFPDEETGFNAIKVLLKSKYYKNLNIKNAIERYAPLFENNTKAYYNKVQQKTGLDIYNRTIDSLNDEELTSLTNVIKQIEGWSPGIEQRII